MRIVLGAVPWFVSIPLVIAQEPKQAALPIPADRRADVYAIYSAVLSPPHLSHVDNNEKYLVMELSSTSMEQDPFNCIQVPPEYRAAFSELLADRAERGHQRHRLELAFKIAKPYDLITDEQIKQRQRSPRTPDRAGEEGGVFRGAVDLINLGNVYFNKAHTLGAVYSWALCGSLCGYGSWRVFVKSTKGEWEERHWVWCMTVADAAERTVQNIRAAIPSLASDSA